MLGFVFVQVCRYVQIKQGFTRKVRPLTNGKAERVIRILMAMWHEKAAFIDLEDRKTKRKRFLHFYNTVKSHKGADGKTSYEVLEIYFGQKA